MTSLLVLGLSSLVMAEPKPKAKPKAPKSKPEASASRTAEDVDAATAADR